MQYIGHRPVELSKNVRIHHWGEPFGAMETGANNPSPADNREERTEILASWLLD